MDEKDDGILLAILALYFVPLFVSILIVVVVAAGLGACNNDEHAGRVLRDAGYENIETTGYRWLGCGERDVVHTGFTATSPGGGATSGVVCCGLVVKACTVRTD